MQSHNLYPLTGTVTTTTTDVLETRPATATILSQHEMTFEGRVFGLPLDLVFTLGALLVLTVLLSVIFSVHDSRSNEEASK